MGRIHLRIADLRRQKKVTQQELADRVGVSYQTVSRWETGAGEPELSLVAALAEYFQVSADQLLGLTPLEGRPMCRRKRVRGTSGTESENICCVPERGIITKTMWNF